MWSCERRARVRDSYCTRNAVSCERGGCPCPWYFCYFVLHIQLYSIPYTAVYPELCTCAFSFLIFELFTTTTVHSLLYIINIHHFVPK